MVVLWQKTTRSNQNPARISLDLTRSHRIGKDIARSNEISSDPVRSCLTRSDEVSPDLEPPHDGEFFPKQTPRERRESLTVSVKKLP